MLICCQPSLHNKAKRCVAQCSPHKCPAILHNQEETGPSLAEPLLKGLRETDSSRCWHHHRRYLSARWSPGEIILTTFPSLFSIRASVTQMHPRSKRPIQRLLEYSWVMSQVPKTLIMPRRTVREKGREGDVFNVWRLCMLLDFFWIDTVNTSADTWIFWHAQTDQPTWHLLFPERTFSWEHSFQGEIKTEPRAQNEKPLQRSSKV